MFYALCAEVFIVGIIVRPLQERGFALWSSCLFLGLGIAIYYTFCSWYGLSVFQCHFSQADFVLAVAVDEVKNHQQQNERSSDEDDEDNRDKIFSAF